LKSVKLAVLFAACGSFLTADAQLAGVIELKENPWAGTAEPSDTFTYSNEAFVLKVVQAKGERLAAYVSDRGAASVNTIPVLDGKETVQYPILASIKYGEGQYMTALPAVLTSKVTIGAGKAVHLGGCLISASRPINPDDSIPVLLLSGAWAVSVEAADPKVTGAARPWFTAFKEDTKSNIDAATAVRVWRIAGKCSLKIYSEPNRRQLIL
jgi:hypothetical protein